MIFEYAVEPILLNNWKDFRYFTEKFGVPNGRLISRFPKKWKRLVYEALAECGEIERKRIEEGLRQLDARMLKRQHDWDSQFDWLTNAETEHLKRLFHAILAKTNRNQRAFVLEGDRLDETEPLWNTRRSRIIPRKAREMAACVAPLLRWSRRLMFIDPYFGPENPRHRRPFEAFMVAMLEGRLQNPPTVVEVHITDRADFDFFKSEVNQRLSGLIPVGVKVRFVRWRQRDGGEKLHNRYILTDIGGVSFEVGLDDGAEGETDEIKLLEKEIYELRLEQYGSSTPAFDLVDDVTVNGVRRI